VRVSTGAVRVEELDYELPEGRIAQFPPEKRDGGRMLELDRGVVRHRWVNEFAECVPEGALLVLNDTRVVRARLLGKRVETSGRVELLLLEPRGPTAHLALAKAKRPLAVGERIAVGDVEVWVRSRTPDGAVVVELGADPAGLMEAHGHVPLPPYVRRPDDASDRERYQTVFARHSGSAAAPTAGLHLTEAALSRLAARGVEVGYVTLHVGVGTFRPVTAEHLDDHRMHEEHIHVSPALVERIHEVRARGGKIVAVGTTVVRALESAALDGRLAPFEGPTALLISPGFDFRVVDALLTNFHAPKSTLLALVFAFAGADAVRAAYRAALGHEYRFLSYGDAMWIPSRHP